MKMAELDCGAPVNDHEQNLTAKDRTAFNVYCNPCERRSIESKSVSWCCECEEGLCDKCLPDHKAIKMTQYHHTVKITSQDIVENYLLLSIPNCELHPELKEDLLCKDHDVVCCNGCLATEHKACKNVVPLDIVAKGVKSSELFQAIKCSIAANKKVSNEVIKERQASEEELKRQEKSIRKEIANIKSRFMEHINNLEKSLLSELAAIPKENKEEFEREKLTIETIEKEIESDKGSLKFVAENGSESQIFSFLHKLKKKQFEIKEKLEEIPPTSRVKITLEEASHEFEAINSLGFLSVRYDSVTKSQEKTDQNCMLIRQGGKELCPHLKIEKEMKIDPKHFMNAELAYDDLALFVTDFVVTEDNHLLVVGNLHTCKKRKDGDLFGLNFVSNNQLVKYNEDMNFVKSYVIDSSKNLGIDDYLKKRCNNRLTCIPKSQQVVISDNEVLHFVNSKTMEKMLPSTFLSVQNIKDVTANSIHIFVAHGDKILVCDLIGRQLNMININKFYTAIILQPNDNILCNNNNCLASLRRDGSDLYLYGRNGIDAVTVDRNGNIYMALNDGIDVIHVHPGEQQVQRVLNSSLDKTKYVVGIEIYKDSRTLFVLQEKREKYRNFGNLAEDDKCMHRKTYFNSCSYSLQVFKALI